jgi:hypothetical protein
MLAAQRADRILKSLANSTGSLECEHRELLHSLMDHLQKSDAPSPAAMMLLRHLATRVPATAVAHA